MSGWEKKCSGGGATRNFLHGVQFRYWNSLVRNHVGYGKTKLYYIEERIRESLLKVEGVHLLEVPEEELKAIVKEILTQNSPDELTKLKGITKIGVTEFAQFAGVDLNELHPSKNVKLKPNIRASITYLESLGYTVIPPGGE